jgi:hypothetical protein
LAQLIGMRIRRLDGVKMDLPDIRPEERTPLVEALLGIIRQLLDHIQQQEETIRQLRDEIAHLKGQKPRPQIRPSQLETPATKAPAEPSGKGTESAKRPKNAELTIHRRVPLHAEHLPPGATFKRFESYVVQDLRIEAQNTEYQRARYDLPGGGSVLAAFPPGVLPIEGGHFGANLVAYILDQYHQAHVTEPLLLEQLWEYGIDISSGQLHRILTAHKDQFHEEKAEILAAALTSSSYIGADDTGARHCGKNGYCTAIGNEWFAYFESTATKSRLNFLQVLQGNPRDYVLNSMARAYWERQKLPATPLALLMHSARQGPAAFGGDDAWQARLAELGIRDERHLRIASEGALLGGLLARGVSADLAVLSDAAGQFVIFVHAGCWIHADRPLDKLVPHNDEHRAAIAQVRTLIWTFYQDLKAYRAKPDDGQRPGLEARFDALVEQRTGYPSIDGLLKEMRDHRADLLRVLSRPEIPLHNNAMESDIREFVKRRKISGGTRSDAGRRCRDTFASLKKTCRKQGICFWQYLHDRIRGLGQVPRLAELIRQKAHRHPAPIVQATPA